MVNKGIQKLFSDVPRTYERVNHILTFGLDILWRRRTARMGAEGGGRRWLDVCSGTGETAFLLRSLASPETQIVLADFSLPMLGLAKEKRDSSSLAFTVSDAKALPFPDNCLDLITISFATRNLNVTKDHLLLSFKEFYRVLRPGGRFVNTETSQPRWRLTKRLFHLYVSLAVKPIGAAISGTKPAYAYLSHTIPRFYTRDQLSEIIKEAGFAKVE